MQLLISDANILIDCIEGQLLELMFRLPYSFATPDILFADELEDCHPHLLGFGLQLKVLDSEAMESVKHLVKRYTGPSRYDCIALALASQESCPLLTGDRALRVAAKNEGIPVHGTLWLTEQMIEHQIISIIQAHEAYIRMKDSGSRLPWKLAFERLVKMEK
ncbi:MAG: PIN domain-containing protein [Xanthomonadales bacterium]|nr:PIN domain-containing protein [Xanthomonadales bacterium]